MHIKRREAHANIIIRIRDTYRWVYDKGEVFMAIRMGEGGKIGF